MKYKTLSLGKSRSVKVGRKETWVKAELTIELEIDDDVLVVEDIQNAIQDLDGILDEEEKSERRKWESDKDKSGQQ